MLRAGLTGGTLLFIAIALVMSGCSGSEESAEETGSGQETPAVSGESHAEEEVGEHDPAEHAESDAGTHDEMASHGGPAEIWEEIEAKNDQLKSAIEAGQLSRVHEMAFEIRDLVVSLDKELEELETADHASMRAQVSVVSGLADDLDRYGDAGNLGETQTKYEELQEALAIIQKAVPNM